MPLIDYYTGSDDLAGEPGVSYLISAGDKKILFDVGFNPKSEHPSPLLRNMKQLGVYVNDIEEGIATIGTIDRAIWLMGLVPEQALAVKRTKDLLDVPIYAVIGGLHYPVEKSRMKFNMQKLLGTGKLPWQRIGKNEVEQAATE